MTSPSSAPERTIKPIENWEGVSYKDLVTDARFRNQLTIREAEEVSGVPYSYFSYSRLGEHAAERRTNQRVAKLGIPYDLLEIRSGRLPEAAADDLVFQDMIMRLWTEYQAAREREA